MRQVVLLVVLLLALALRFYRLQAQSFWNDEGNSARLSERPIPLIIEGTASDIHPPLYYLLLRGWRELLGESEFGLRAFSAFAGVTTVAVTFALGQALSRRRRTVVAGTAALLAAVHPSLVYYSQETRMYSLLALLATLATLLLVRWLINSQQSTIRPPHSTLRPPPSALPNPHSAFPIPHSAFPIPHSAFPIPQSPIAYVVCAAAGLYTHYFFTAVLLAHNVIVLFWLLNRHRRSRSPSHSPTSSPPLLLWPVMMGATFLLYLPWLPVMLRHAGREAGGRAGLLEFFMGSGRWLAFGATVEPAQVAWPLAALGLLLVVGVVTGSWQWWPAAVSLVVPVLVAFALGTTQSEFYKFLLVAVPPLCLLLAQAVAGGGPGQRWRPWLAPLLALLLWGSGRSLHNLYFNPAYARADYRGMAARIEAEAHANAGVILNAPNQWEVFTYYHDEGAPVYPLPRGHTPEQLYEELEVIAARHNRLYAIFWGEGQQDPERRVERWLDEHAFKATNEWVGDVRLVTYAVAAEAATEIATPLEAQFGPQIRLRGYTLGEADVRAGDIIQVTLFWETAAPLAQRYKVFLHLVDAGGQLLAQRDSEPGGGLALTTTWPPGELIVDNHGILVPPGAAAGTYHLLLGLYDLADPAARLPVTGGPGGRAPSNDALPLAAITLVQVKDK